MPKKTIMAVTAALIMLPTLAMAKDHNRDGINYTGPAKNIATVAETLKDAGRFTEIDVIMEGRLIHQISADEFMFQDDSGKVRVEIDDDIKLPTPIDADTQLRIFGEFEGGSTPKVEVEHIKLI